MNKLQTKLFHFLFTFFLLAIANSLNAATCNDIGNLSSTENIYSESIGMYPTEHYSVNITEAGTIDNILVTSGNLLNVKVSKISCEAGDIIDNYTASDKSTSHSYSTPFDVSIGDVLYFQVKNTKNSTATINIIIGFTAFSGANLKLSEVLPPEYPEAHGDITFVVRSNNMGPDSADADIVISTVYSQDVTIISAEQTDGGGFDCSPSSGVLSSGTPIVCTKDSSWSTIGEDNNKDITYKVQTSYLGTLTQTSVISSGTNDPSTTNNTLVSSVDTSVIENADDICYSEPITKGIEIGPMSFMFRNELPLRNNSSDGDTLTDVIVEIDEDGMGGSFADDCGVDNDNSDGDDKDGGTCSEDGNSLINIGGSSTALSVNDDIESGDESNSVWTRSLFEMGFMQEHLYTQYVKDGITYRGKLNKCPTPSGYTCSKPKDFSLRKKFVGKGDLIAIGNASLCVDKDPADGLCDENQGQISLEKNQFNNMIYINATSSPSQVGTEPTDLNNTTAASLNLPDGAIIEWAGLYWQAQIHDIKTDEGAAQKELAKTIKFKKPSGNYIELTATEANHSYIFVKNSGRYEEHYQSFIELTNHEGINYMNGSGDYWVANIQATTGSLPTPGAEAAWSIQIIYSFPDDSTEGTTKSIAINDGYQALYGNDDSGINYASEVNGLNGNSECSEVREDTGSYGKTVDVPVSGFITPKSSGFKNNFTVFMTDPDPSGRGDESFSITKNGATDTIIDENIAGQDFTGWFYGIDNIDVNSEGTRTVVNNLDRKPNYINPIGMSIKNYTIIDALATEQTSAIVKFVTGPDRLFLGVIGFATELQKPQICYDYTYGQNDAYTSDYDISDPRIENLFTSEPINVKLYFENKENSDVTITDLKVNIDPIDSETSYELGSTKVAKPNQSREDVTDSNNDTSNNNDIGIGDINSLEYFYVYYNLEHEHTDVNASINATLHFNSVVVLNKGTTDEETIDLGRQPLAIADMDPCQGSSTYSPAAGLFNVVHNGEVSDNEPGYYFNLPTQVVNRSGNFKAITLQGDDFNVSDTSIATGVVVEMLDVSGFQYASATCNDQDVRVVSTLDDDLKVWAMFTDSTSSTVDLSKTDMEAAGFFTNAVSNAAFRISYQADANGTAELFNEVGDQHYLINFNSYAGQACQGGSANTVNNACASEGDNANENANGGQSGMNAEELKICIQCIFGSNVKNLCSRDNFSIRPESYEITVNDYNTTTTLKTPITGIDIDIASGYDYILDINATDHDNIASVPSYNTSDVNVSLTWSPTGTLNCNDTINKTLTSTFYNGDADENLSIYQVGEYILSVTDTQWTKVDYDSSLIEHHTTENNFNPSRTTDCIPNNTIVNTEASSALNGCSISSSHSNSEYAKTYINQDIEFHPYKFNIVSNITSGLNGTSNFIYMADIGTDENMSVHVKSIITAVGKNSTAGLTNFVAGCYAKPLTININKTGTQNTSLITKYKFSDKNASTILHTQAINSVAFDANISINTDTTYFKKLQEGSIDTTTYVNFDRNISIVANPEDINYTTVTVSMIDPTITFNADEGSMSASGTKTLNQSVKHYYGKAHSGRKRYEVVNDGDNKNANIYYEVYCSGKTPSAGALGNTCDTTLLQGTQRTDDSRWYINPNHTPANDGDIKFVRHEDGTGVPADIVDATIVDATVAPTVAQLSYDASKGYPYKTTMNITPSEWLIYNEDNASASFNTFPVEFEKAGTGWSGEHETDTTTESHKAIKTNRRTMW